MDYCDQADGVERKELSLLPRFEPPIYIDFNLTGHKRRLTFYIVVQKIGIYNFLAC